MAKSKKNKWLVIKLFWRNIFLPILLPFPFLFFFICIKIIFPEYIVNESWIFNNNNAFGTFLTLFCLCFRMLQIGLNIWRKFYQKSFLMFEIVSEKLKSRFYSTFLCSKGVYRHFKEYFVSMLKVDFEVSTSCTSEHPAIMILFWIHKNYPKKPHMFPCSYLCSK